MGVVYTPYARARRLRDQGMGLRPIARELGVSHETVRRLLAAGERIETPKPKPVETPEPTAVVVPLPKPKPPAPTAGDALRERLEAALFDDGGKPIGIYDARDRELIDQAAQLADQIETMGAILERDGLLTAGASGALKEHPALTSQRQLRGRLAAVLKQIRIPDPSAVEVLDRTSIKNRNAAITRWSRERARLTALGSAAEGGWHGPRPV